MSEEKWNKEIKDVKSPVIRITHLQHDEIFIEATAPVFILPTNDEICYGAGVNVTILDFNPTKPKP